MTAPIRPASEKAYGREKWVYLAACAAVGAPTAAEVGAGTILDISCMLFGDSGRPSQTTNRVKKAKRVCDTVVYEQIGDTSYEGGEIKYAFTSQGAAASNGVKAWEKFPSGTTGFLVQRTGIDVNTDLATGQFVNVFPVEFGPPMPTIEGSDEAAETAAVQTIAVTSTPSFKVAIVA